uniref:Small ribosomal subunit protein uS8c n=1 Tax=Triparma laevis TaxID=1534972 RepID=A0A0K2RWZ9_9STRA|nr:chloroplast 30S ribosomal protein S8 [Triparma laevis]BAS19117.1 chloroplast 30S ribosomal protein S8 [Triparma laevis]
MVNDTISDMLTRIRNANMVKHQIVEIPFTKMSNNLAIILKEEGFIEDFETYSENSRNFILISMKYKGTERLPVISKIKRVSKPGLRIYSNKSSLPNILGNLGIAIISTSQGLMTNIKARQLGIGGEVLCYIW